ncbi:IucA/IucC family siderophore biosynthesis protein [uncultured Pseudokineococcus sp.]|uniref:IucA/IucC family protein n=1 Tax=uncultured Pseudokineococcus sp. TaxID=1642928 RepID=UPI00260CA928|nr:IucA/IucC family protein [uncultured Pseudokineococcus sp.]
MTAGAGLDPADLADLAVGGAEHLEPTAMAAAQRHLVTKALSELAHERLLRPEPLDGAPVDEVPTDGTGTDGPGTADGRSPWRTWSLRTPGAAPHHDRAPGTAEYRYRARVLPLEHWDVDAASVTRTVDGAPADLDVQDLVVELAPWLGVPDALLHTYLEELAATLAGAAWKLHHRRADARVLARADLQTVERSMTEGHPGFLANNGRIGFGLDDAARYAPEAGQPARLVWVAARRDRAVLALGAGVDEDGLLDGQLGPEVRAAFAHRLRDLGCDPVGYVLLPLHPWQWDAKVAVTFAPDLARRDLVLLGRGPDRYVPQQSIRTFFDVDRPERHYVKTALAVQNMGFVRGLSPAYMASTPAVNDWVADVVAGDPELGGSGFGVLRELAAVGYTGDAYHRCARPGPRSAHQRMVAALWRESPVPRLADGERAMTMAALLHRDHEGRSLVGALVEGSGLGARAWLERYLRAYVRPLVQCLLVHDLAFMPHGENVLVVLRDDVVERVLVKDIGEEVAVFGDRPLPDGVERVRVADDPGVRLLSLFTDVVDGVLRHLVAILDRDGLLPAEESWRVLAEVLDAHRRDHPAAHERFDVFTPTFAHSCLNRLQLRNTLQMVDLADQVSSLLMAGELDNPVAPHDPRRRTGASASGPAAGGAP